MENIAPMKAFRMFGRRQNTTMHMLVVSHADGTLLTVASLDCSSACPPSKIMLDFKESSRINLF
jgi:hypothetical protein